MKRPKGRFSFSQNFVIGRAQEMVPGCRADRLPPLFPPENLLHALDCYS
jgi:hypothetical protein